ncbi:class I SAM-dependent methyltransferase [Wenzhouxiangella sp. XN79A]|uniref:class I SAM-dependent methyltransferase n=1 Tax=Wenzhouxiangella sp. XN79A TaxID=2724193 RepID=UPI00144A8D98|nr:class I SAM-dependent methyltransferase [Wenzhouxiangella sp. XN79A]NKI36436.1 class I SAM-dependent methyltransferase [Wenzhouxiangella sp. XN79A]
MNGLRLTGWNHKQSIKEVIRHVLYRAGLFSLLSQHRQRRGFITEHLTLGDRAKRFDEIYERGVWRHSDGQVADSGLGSELAVTEMIRSELPGILTELNVKSLVDLGCGDWTWMSRIQLPCRYLGLDIVQAVVNRNEANYGTDLINFQQLDAVTEELPDCDAVLCREVMFHLSFEDARFAFDNIRRHARWVIVTSDSGIWFNSDIPSGDFRMLNLQRAPFRFPSPDLRIVDDELVPGRFLGIWNTARLDSKRNSVP